MSHKPANRILAALLSEQGRVVDDGARHHVEAIDHTEPHDLHRMADDGCPHHHDDPWGAERMIDYLDLRRQGYTEKEATEMTGEAVPAVIQKSNHGLHLPTGAKERKALPICTGVLDYFPKALAAVAEVSRIGNDQHNPGQPLHWAKGKSTDHADCAIRHFAERGTVDVVDGGRHTAKAAWRVLAHLEMEIEAEEAGVSYADYIAALKAREAA
jgi:hypothetical protein